LKSSGRYFAAKSWSNLCGPKKEGGLDFNSALLEKFAWTVTSGRNNICMDVLRSKDKVRKDWLMREPSKRASPIWKGIENAKKLLAPGACYIVGDGKSINVWLDTWIPWVEGSNQSLGMTLSP
jgi:hypothetical protein